MPKIVSSKNFEKAIKKLPKDRQKRVINQLKKFCENPNIPSLKFRQLAGIDGRFIINAVHGDRIILQKIDADTYGLVDVGPHDNVYRRIKRVNW